MIIKKNIPTLIKAVLGEKSKSWITVYFDLLRLVDNGESVYIKNKAMVIASLTEALSNNLFKNSQLRGETKTLFDEDWQLFRKRNSLFNPYSMELLPKLFERWLEKVHALLSKSLDNACTLNIEVTTHQNTRTHKTSKKLSNPYQSSNLESRLGAYADAYGFMYQDIVELVHCNTLNLATRNIAIGSLLRAFKGLLNTAAELIQSGATIPRKETEGEKRKKAILKNATGLSDKIIEVVFHSNAHEHQHGNQLGTDDNYFNLDWLDQFENALSDLLNALDQFYTRAQDTIESIAMKSELNDRDIDILKNLFHSRDLLLHFLNTSKINNLISTLDELHFFDFPHRIQSLTNYPYNNLYPQSRILRERATNEPLAIVKVICNWPKDVDERIIADSLAALEKIPTEFALQALPSLLEWAKQHQRNKHFLCDLLDFLCTFTGLKQQDAATTDIYSKLIRLILKNLVNASRYDVEGKIRYYQAPFISPEKIEKLVSLAYSILGIPFLSWFLCLCNRMWDYDNPTLNSILQVWIPNFSPEYRESILTNYDALFLLYYCDQIYEAVKSAQYPNRLISSLARRKNPISIRIAYEIAVRLTKNDSTLLSSQMLSKLACNSNLFFGSSGNTEYRCFVFLAWPYLLSSSRQTLKKWWDDSLSQSARFNWLTNHSGIIPEEFQEDYKNLLAIRKAEIEKFSYNWSPRPNQTIEEWIEQAEKAITNDHLNFSLLGNVEKIIEQLEEDIVRRPFPYLAKSIVWLRSKSKIIDAILTKINVAEIQNHSDEYTSYLSELENMISDLSTEELWPHINFFLRTSQHYPSSIPLQCQETFLSVQWILFKRVARLVIKNNFQIGFNDTLNKQSVNTIHGRAIESILNYAFIYSSEKIIALAKLEANFDSLLIYAEIPEVAYFLGEYLPYFATFTPKIGSQLITQMTQKNQPVLSAIQLNLWNGFAHTRFLLSKDPGEILLRGYLQLVEENVDSIFLPIAQNQSISRLWSNFFHWCRVSNVNPHDSLFINLVKKCKSEILKDVVERFSRFVGDLQFDENLNQAKKEETCAFFLAMLKVIIAHHGTQPLSKFGWSFKNGFIGPDSLLLLQQALQNKETVEPVWLIFKALEEHSKHDVETVGELVLQILREYRSDELHLGKQQLDSSINTLKAVGITPSKLKTIKGLRLRKFGPQ